MRTGADILLDALADGGVTDVLGLPGSQTIGLYEAIRRSRVRATLAGSELSAMFMANGYFRASGRTAVVSTIPGPGFAYALPGAAEAFLDSAAVLWITVSPAEGPGHRFQLQAIDQPALAAPVVKRAYRVRDVEQIAEIARQALTEASRGEPGPVLLELDQSVLEATTGQRTAAYEAQSQPATSPHVIAQAVEHLRRASRVAFLVGAGAADCAADLRLLVEGLPAPVVTTTSGRGILPDGHPLLILGDPGLSGSASVLNPFFQRCDIIVALGWKASHNSTNGFRLRLPEDRLIHVDASRAVLGANYPTLLSIESDAGAFVRRLRDALAQGPTSHSLWTESELAEWRARTLASLPAAAEPSILGGPADSAQELFAALGRVLPVTACVVTDSGLHQMLTRKYYRVRSPRGLLVPTNFQSMGFGLPAAIGAKLAAPERTVVAIVGDGSLAMSGMELMTAVRERIALTIVLFNDESLGLIRLGQLSEFGHAHATHLVNPDYQVLAQAMGIRHVAFSAGQGHSADELLRLALAGDGVSILEVRLRDSVRIRRGQAAASVRSQVRRTIGSTAAKVRRWTKPS